MFVYIMETRFFCNELLEGEGEGLLKILRS
jgi:hypothetical protein